MSKIADSHEHNCFHADAVLCVHEHNCFHAEAVLCVHVTFPYICKCGGCLPSMCSAVTNDDYNLSVPSEFPVMIQSIVESC